MWPGVHRAGLPRLSGGTDAGPGAAAAPLDKLRPAHLVALYNAMADEGLSGASLRHMHAVIRRALNVAVKWQLITVNPASLVDSPRPPA